MGIFSSKKKYYVSSSTCPMFDGTKRLKNYMSGMLDYTATSPLERSEYFRKHYEYSRLPKYKSLLTWIENSGYVNQLGRIESQFLGDAKFNNEEVAKALKPHIKLDPEDVFGVFSTSLEFFSEDFYIKHLATLQGKAKLVYQDSDANYTIDFPTENTIRATFKTGEIIEGTLPDFTRATRFLEIQYNVIKEKKETKPNPDPTQPPIEIVSHDYQYGFFQYKEGSGIPELDKLIVFKNTDAKKTFFPVVPIRTNTAWFTGSKANAINDILAYLKIYDSKKGSKSAYSEIQRMCVEGMKKGSINDIDYITLIHGVAINSRNNADQKYIFNFFFNLYQNQALAEGRAPESFYGGKKLSSGKGFFSTFLGGFKGLFSKRNDAIYRKLHLHNSNSNLDLYYGWVTSDYFEQNGKWNPEAKPGDYGTLAGWFTHSWEIRVPAVDSEGNIISWTDEDGTVHVKYVIEVVVDYYNLTLFCYQASPSRWKFLAFADLQLSNHVYHGKHVNTNAYEAVKDTSEYSEVRHDFSNDVGLFGDKKYIYSFNYVKNPGEPESAFIVPLEASTFSEIGAKDALDVCEGSQFLIFNCWVKKKIKWYQRGWFGVIGSFVLMTLLAPIPILGELAIAFHLIMVTAKAIELAQKTLSIIVGDRWAAKIVTWIIKIVRTVLCVVATLAFKIPVFGWLIWGICMTIVFVLDAATIIWQGGTIQEAVKKALISSAISGLSTAVAGNLTYAPDASSGATGTAGSTAANSIGTGTQIAIQAGVGFLEGSLNVLANGGSFKDAFKSGLKQGVISGAMVGLSKGFDKLMEMFPGSEAANQSLASGVGEVAKDTSLSVGGLVQGAIAQVVLNPMNIVDFVGMAQEEIYFHKMANLENDFQEFANKYDAAQRVLRQLAEATSSTVTAETVLRSQVTFGRSMTMFPESYQTIDASSAIAMATMTGSDVCKTVLGNIDTLVDNALTLDGYEPASLHYSDHSYTLAWDAGTNIDI